MLSSLMSLVYIFLLLMFNSVVNLTTSSLTRCVIIKCSVWDNSVCFYHSSIAFSGRNVLLPLSSSPSSLSSLSAVTLFYPPSFVFCMFFIFIPIKSRLCYAYIMWICSLPLECGRLAWNYMLKEKWLLFSQNLTIVSGSLVMSGISS